MEEQSTKPGMSTKAVILFGFVVVVIVSSSVVSYMNSKAEKEKKDLNAQIATLQSQVASLQTATASPSASASATADETAGWKSDAENVVSVFTENFLASVPGEGSDGVNGTKANVALGKLTAEAQATVKKNSPSSISGGLALFCGIQDTPDRGTSISSSTKSSDGTVTVISKWTYSGGGAVTKTFTLVTENEEWKISKVK